MSPFAEHASCEEGCDLAAPAPDKNHITFFLFLIIFPYILHASYHLLLYLLNIQPLTFSEADLRHFSCFLAWLFCERTLSLLKPQCLCIWLATQGANEPNSATVRPIYRGGWERQPHSMRGKKTWWQTSRSETQSRYLKTMSHFRVPHIQIHQGLL